MLRSKWFSWPKGPEHTLYLEQTLLPPLPRPVRPMSNIVLHHPHLYHYVSVLKSLHAKAPLYYTSKYVPLPDEHVPVAYVSVSVCVCVCVSVCVCVWARAREKEREWWGGGSGGGGRYTTVRWEGRRSRWKQDRVFNHVISRIPTFVFYCI